MEDTQEPGILAITTTVSTLAQAQALARTLVEQRLAACVQLEPGVQSCYRWQGQLCEEAEVRLTIKTVAERQAAVQACFAEHHPYELPQFTAAPLAASAAYAQWVRAEVG